MVKDVANLLPPVIELSRQAAALIMDYYQNRTEVNIQTKQDDSPVTEADLVADKCIVAGLNTIARDIPIISEEGAITDYQQRQHWSRFWLVDPLDGTKEFIHGTGEFTVNIALIENQQPVLGVIYIPITGECYFAATGVGAHKQEQGKAAQAIHTAKVEKGDVTVVTSRRHRSKTLHALADEFADCRINRIGSSWKLCLLAEGKADLYTRFGPTFEWDLAAGQCIVEQAGGKVVRTNLTPLSYNNPTLMHKDFFAIGDGTFDWLHYLQLVGKA